MSNIPEIDELNKGIYKCLSCGKKLTMDGDGRGASVQTCPKCAAPVFPPFKLKNYWCLKPLGGGGMGSVYYAISEADGKECAIKVIPQWQAGNTGLVDNMRREAETGLAIGRHKNLVAAIEHGCFNDEYFLAMEFIKGERLDSIISSHGAMPEPQAWDIATQLAEAVAHICAKGYLFRDMKPENAIVEADGNVRLFDYGLSMTIEAAQTAGESEEIEGSPFYLPPERIVGAPEGEYSEIYSIGMVLFQMLNGATYYSQAELGDLMAKHVTSNPLLKRRLPPQELLPAYDRDTRQDGRENAFWPLRHLRRPDSHHERAHHLAQGGGCPET